MFFNGNYISRSINTSGNNISLLVLIILEVYGLLLISLAIRLSLLKDLFDKGYSLIYIKNKTQDDIREDLESSRYIEAYAERRNRFFPDVNFATASNFARFGLAEEYYETSIKRIYQTYPYAR